MEFKSVGSMESGMVLMAAVKTNSVKGGYWLASTNDTLPSANIDAMLFSHLFVGHAGVNSETYEVTIDPSQDVPINQFTRTVRQKNPDIKTLLSIRAENDVFAKIVAEPTNVDIFIKSSIAAAKAGEFNGLDLQWLFPSSHQEMDGFESLLGLWRKAVAKEAIDFSLPQLILVATVSNLPYLIPSIHYPIQAIKQNLNWVNVISYDFYTPTSSNNHTGPSSAFHNPKTNTLSTCFGIESWTKALGYRPRKQIVFGIPFHGWAWKLSNSHEHEVFAKANGAAIGENIFSDGKIYYSNVQKFIEDNLAENQIKDRSYVIGYTYSGTTWIAYESEYTIADKISEAKSRKVLGYFASNIAADDDTNTLANAAFTNW